MEKHVNKYSWLEKLDKPIYGTKFGKAMINLFQLDVEDVSTIKGIGKNAKNITALKFAGNGLQKTIGNSLLRVSKAGLITSALIEIPAIIKSVTDTEGSIMDKAEALGKQLVKSAGYVGLINAGIALVGALLFPYGVVAELAGMAVGSAVGIMASNKLNTTINNIFETKIEEEPEIKSLPPDLFT